VDAKVVPCFVDTSREPTRRSRSLRNASWVINLKTAKALSITVPASDIIRERAEVLIVQPIFHQVSEHARQDF
jgi:hypothetical protein